MLKAIKALSLAGLLLLPILATAESISGTGKFTAVVDGATHSGTFSFTNLDTSRTYVNSKEAGFTLTTNFDTSGNGGNAFSYLSNGYLQIGGLAGVLSTASGVGVLQISPAVNDWYLAIPNFASSQNGAAFGYRPTSGGGTNSTYNVTVTFSPRGAINHGLFIGARDPKSTLTLELFGRFDSNARSMAAAFGARPNTRTTLITGDLRLDESGEPRQPITFEIISQVLGDIRKKMRRGDTLTVYINNHGGAYYQGSVRDSGEGDEVVHVGDYLLDNALANMLKEFDGYPVTVFLDSCHGGGFWGGTDSREAPPSGLGFDDLNQLRKIALYSGAAEDGWEYGWGSSWSFWGKALLEAFQTPMSWSPSGLAAFLEKRTLELAWIGDQKSPVWYSLAVGDLVAADPDLLTTFWASSADFDPELEFLSGPDPVGQFESLLAAVKGLGPGTSLVDKIALAKVYYDESDVESTCGVISAFRKEISAQKGKKISLNDFETLDASADFLARSIDCN